jgi:hypothetical protein
VQAQLFDGSNALLALHDAHERPETLFIGRDDLDRAGQPVTQLGLAQMADVCFGGVIAVARRHIIHPRPDQPQEGIDGFGIGKVIAAFGHMAVIVDPAGQHLHMGHDQGFRFRRAIRRAEKGHSIAFVMFAQHLARAPVAVFQGPQEADQVAVANPLQLADGVVARLRVGLASD